MANVKENVWEKTEEQQKQLQLSMNLKQLHYEDVTQDPMTHSVSEQLYRFQALHHSPGVIQVLQIQGVQPLHKSLNVTLELMILVAQDQLHKHQLHLRQDVIQDPQIQGVQAQHKGLNVTLDLLTLVAQDQQLKHQLRLSHYVIQDPQIQGAQALHKGHNVTLDLMILVVPDRQHMPPLRLSQDVTQVQRIQGANNFHQLKVLNAILGHLILGVHKLFPR